MAVINSTGNFRVLQWSKLKNKAHREKQRLFIAEGYHLLSEAYKAHCLTELITTEKAAPFPVPTYQVTYDVMEKLSAMATPTKLLGICRQRDETAPGTQILLIDQVHHPGNLGTIIRSAVAFGVDTMVLGNSVDVYNAKVIQASQGMLFHINILKRPLPDFIAAIKKEGFQIIGTDVREGTPLHTVKSAKKRAILIGGEGDGVDDALLKLCDTKVTIQMDDKCESLNVGVAASIVLYGLAHVSTL
ncbi:MAG: RNA methyltransferase [Defluviitaleaceae bacterium]|nr:RNA methyltransferase [Defluviitaleaceae bacterium]